MDIKLPKISFSKINYLKYINRLTILITFSIFSYLGYFIYFNLYGTITEAQQVVLLKQEVAPESLDLPKIENVLTRLEKRINATKSIKTERIKNFFALTTTKPTDQTKATTTPKN